MKRHPRGAFFRVIFHLFDLALRCAVRQADKGLPMSKSHQADSEINAAALEYHEKPVPGKLAIKVTKPAETQRDLSLAYTPGVAEPVRRIADNPDNAYRYTAKSNLVAVITDGTAVLGLGNVGALAGKPVMEGKAVLFKHFADIDVFDIEVNAEHPQEFIETVVRIAPTFGGINLEDIKAPECFHIEEQLKEMLDIPVFHDDQHGTAVVTLAAGPAAATILSAANSAAEKTTASRRIVDLIRIASVWTRITRWSRTTRSELESTAGNRS